MVRNDNNIPITGLGRGRNSGVMCPRPWPLLVAGVCSGNVDLGFEHVLKPWCLGPESRNHVKDFPPRIAFQTVIGILDVCPN